MDPKESFSDSLRQAIKEKKHWAQDRHWTDVEIPDADAKYRNLVEQIPAVVYAAAIDETSTTLYTSPQIEEMLGFPLDEWRQDPDLWLEQIHDDDRERVLAEVSNTHRTGKPLRVEYRMFRRDGQVIWVRDDANVVSDAAGKPEFLWGVMFDITDRKRAEEALEEQRKTFSHAEQIAHIGNWDWDIVHNKLRWSNEMYRIFGINRQEFDGRVEAVFKAIHPEDVEKVKAEIRHAIEMGVPGQTVEYRIVLPDGTERFVRSERETERDDSGKTVRMLGTTQDITERKQARQDLRESHEQLRRLAVRLQAVREEERTRIAREIHDDLGQALTGLKMDLSWLMDRPQDNRSKARERTRSMIALVDTTIESVRRISAHLRPGILDDFGLAAAIEWEAEQFSSRSGIHCAVDIAVQELDVDDERATPFFRILQEALTNVVRHADAGQVRVNLREVDDQLIMEVADNGKGIKDEELNSRRALGLRGMRERAAAFGGTVDVCRAKQGGTVVAVSMPHPHSASVDSRKIIS